MAAGSTGPASSRGAGAHWRIPSDHLPVGAQLRSTDGGVLRIISWNVLSTHLRIQNIEEQGLRGSLPWQLWKAPRTVDDPPSPGPGLSRRDALVLATLELLIRPGPHQAAVLALQEATAELLAALAPLLESEGWVAGPEVYQPTAEIDFGRKHNEDTVLLYRPAALTLESVELHGSDVFADGKKLVVANFAPVSACTSGAASTGGDGNDGETWRLRVVAGKIRGTPPAKPTKDGLWISRAVHDWAGFLASLCPAATGGVQASATTTLCVGDFNFLETEVLEACRQAGAALVPCPFCAASDVYPTNPNPMPWRASERNFHGPPFWPKRIDHVLVDTATAATDRIMLLGPEELIPGLSAAVEVLRCSANGNTLGWAAGATPPGPVPPWELSPHEAVAMVGSWRNKDVEGSTRGKDSVEAQYSVSLSDVV